MGENEPRWVFFDFVGVDLLHKTPRDTALEREPGHQPPTPSSPTAPPRALALLQKAGSCCVTVAVSSAADDRVPARAPLAAAAPTLRVRPPTTASLRVLTLLQPSGGKQRWTQWTSHGGGGGARGRTSTGARIGETILGLFYHGRWFCLPRPLLWLVCDAEETTRYLRLAAPRAHGPTRQRPFLPGKE